MAENRTQLDRIEQGLWAGQLGEVERVEARLREEVRREKEGLVELFDARLGSLKAWGVAAFLGGQTIAAVVGALVVKTGSTPEPVRAAVSAVGRFIS